MRASLLGFFLALTTYVSAEPGFIPPDDSYPLLRRDLLPLDVDEIQDLASQLAILGDGPAPVVAEQLQARAKTLALSERLAPTEQRARAALAALTNGETRSAPPKDDLNAARKATFQTAQWLIELPPDTEGNHLGQLILDVLAPISPKNPLIQRRNTEGEISRWHGVIANLSDFAGEPKLSPTLPGVTETPDTPAAPGKYQTLALLTEIPMLCKAIPQRSPIIPALVKTSLVITETKEDEEGSLRFKPSPDFDTNPLDQALQTFFKSVDQPLPEGFNLNINTDSRQYVSKNKENIAAPIAMMLDAALSGRPLRRNTYLFARLAADGTLDRPYEAWEILLHLTQSKVPQGSRLIVGPGLDEELTALIVLLKPEFFVNYEVISAPTFEIARELFYEDGKPVPEVIAAIAGYQEVREKAFAANSLATFLSLASVEDRLVSASNSSARHLSAKMLAAQAVRRPANLTRYMFAQELDRRLRPLSAFRYIPDETTERQIRDLYKETRESIQPLERLIQLNEQGIYHEALDLTQQLNSIARTTKSFFETRAAMEAFEAELETYREKLQILYLKNDKK